MRNGFAIIDADRHVIEPVEMWTEYLPPPYRERAPYFGQLVPDEPLARRIARLGAKALLVPMDGLLLDGKPIWRPMPEEALIEITMAAELRPDDPLAGAHPARQLANMDQTGIDIAFLFPTYTLFLIAIDDMEPERASAFARAYNAWLYEYCRPDPRRLRGVGVISQHEPANMVAELERVAAYGWTTVMLRPNPIKGRILSDPAYEPFFAACEAMSMAVALHEAAHSRVPAAGGERFDSHFGRHSCSHPMEHMMAFLALLEGGVLERHPRLRVAFLEAGCSWLPYWLWRLDVHRDADGEVADTVRMEPSSYFRRQCFATLEPSEPLLARMPELLGPDTLLFGTDFPHIDHRHDIVDQLFDVGRELPADVLRTILWDNPARFFGVADSDAPTT